MTFTNINHQSKIIKLGGSNHIVEDVVTHICKSKVRPKTFGKRHVVVDDGECGDDDDGGFNLKRSTCMSEINVKNLY